MSNIIYPTIAIDLTDYIATGRRGKFIIYRSDDGELYVPFAETTNATYTDFTAVPCQTYYYKYRFILGARSGDMIAEPIVVNAEICPTVSPTPTCALYSYAYSHQVTHSALGDISGNYNFDQTTGVAANAINNVQIIYNPHAETWVIASKTTVVSIRHRSDSPRVDYQGMQGVYVSQNVWSITSDWWKTTNTANTRVSISYSPRTATYSVRSPSDQPTDRITWSLPGEEKYPSNFSSIQVNYKDNYFDIRAVRVQDMTPEELGEFINSNAVYYYKNATSGKFIPKTGWVGSDFWKTSPSIYNKYIKNAVLNIGCFQLTPTPTSSPVPLTPTPTPYSTATSSSLIYLVTEADIPITTETGVNFVAE